jgi:hypothetical protein
MKKPSRQNPSMIARLKTAKHREMIDYTTEEKHKIFRLVDRHDTESLKKYCRCTDRICYVCRLIALREQYKAIAEKLFNIFHGMKRRAKGNFQ